MEKGTNFLYSVKYQKTHRKEEDLFFFFFSSSSSFYFSYASRCQNRCQNAKKTYSYYE